MLPIRFNFDVTDSHIRMVPVEEILSEWEHADWPFMSWNDLLQYKRNDYGYERLKRHIHKYGMRYPVYEWHKVEEGQRHWLGNGHHRLAVLIDAGHTHIPISTDFDGQWSEDWSDDDNRELNDDIASF